MKNIYVYEKSKLSSRVGVKWNVTPRDTNLPLAQFFPLLTKFVDGDGESSNGFKNVAATPICKVIHRYLDRQ